MKTLNNNKTKIKQGEKKLNSEATVVEFEIAKAENLWCEIIKSGTPKIEKEEFIIRQLERVLSLKIRGIESFSKNDLKYSSDKYIRLNREVKEIQECLTEKIREVEYIQYDETETNEFRKNLIIDMLESWATTYLDISEEEEKGYDIVMDLAGKLKANKLSNEDISEINFHLSQIQD